MTQPRYYRSRVASWMRTWWRHLPPTDRAFAVGFLAGLVVAVVPLVACPGPTPAPRVVIRRAPPRVVTEYVERAAVAAAARDTARAAAQASDSVRRATAPARAPLPPAVVDPLPAAVRAQLDAYIAVALRDSLTIERQRAALREDSLAFETANAAVAAMLARVDTLETVEIPKAEARGERRGFRRGLKWGVPLGAGGLAVLAFVL